MVSNSIDRILHPLGIIYFDGSFLAGNERRAIYEYKDTGTIAIEVDMRNRIIRFWNHPKKIVQWEEDFIHSDIENVCKMLKNRYFPLVSKIKFELVS